eukprot:sb/3478899/
MCLFVCIQFPVLDQVSIILFFLLCIEHSHTHLQSHTNPTSQNTNPTSPHSGFILDRQSDCTWGPGDSDPQNPTITDEIPSLNIAGTDRIRNYWSLIG